MCCRITTETETGVRTRSARCLTAESAPNVLGDHNRKGSARVTGASPQDRAEVRRGSPVAVAVEQRTDDPAVEHAGKRVVVRWRCPLRDRLPVRGTRAVRGNLIWSAWSVERADAQPDGVGRPAAEADRSGCVAF